MSPHVVTPSTRPTASATSSRGPGATELPRLDEMAARVREGAGRFARLSLPDRIVLAREMQHEFLRVAPGIVARACLAKGITPNTPLEGEEWGNAWFVVRQLRLVVASLEALRRRGNTPIGRIGRTLDGRLSVGVFPAGALDRMLFSGVTAETHMQDGLDEAAVYAGRASFYKTRGHDGRTVLVLGAGNLWSIPVMDLVTKLFNEGKACLLKMNPVNAYAGPFLETAFAGAIRRGFLAIAYGGGEEGSYLVQHPAIDEIHLTGSDSTYDLLMWGPAGPDRESRKAGDAPLIRKPVTAELGNVSPVLVVPGPYNDKELAFQGEMIAGAVAHNGSFNCNSAKVLLSPAGWDRRGALLEAVERGLEKAPPRVAYYLGADERWRRATRGRQGLRLIGVAGEGQLPWTLVPGLDPSDPDERAFTTEPFCPVLSETEIGTSDPVEYLERAVEFANRRLWGTLSASLVVHPRTLKDPVLGTAVERAIMRLRYGAVAVNAWSGLAFALGSPPWGGYPGSTPEDIQSGTGWVHNTSMLEGIEKAVLRHPLTCVPKPATLPSHRTVHTLMRRLTYLEKRGSWSKLPGVVGAAMRG